VARAAFAAPRDRGARGARRVEVTAPLRSIVGAVADLDLAAWKHEVAGGELARGVTADQQDLERAC
jgi:hypothetical protein